VTVPLAPALTVQVGPFLRYWDTGHTAGTLFAVDHPYGAGPFGNLGGLADVRYDTRNVGGLPTKGVLLEVIGRGVPAIWDAQDAYSSVRAQGTAYLTPSGVPLSPTLALRAGGMKVWGTAPYQDMAHIGSFANTDDPFTVRGFYPDRFTGDAAVWGNAQLSFIVAHPKIIVPTDLGLLVLDDVGRVFLNGAPSGRWHDAYGGGVSLGLFHGAIAGTAIVARSSERTFFYIGGRTGI
jgi:outer membrane protein assembly factor BamA